MKAIVTRRIPELFAIIKTASTGCGRRGYKDGPAATAEFNNPVGSCCCPDGTVFIAGDTRNHNLCSLSALMLAFQTKATTSFAQLRRAT